MLGAEYQNLVQQDALFLQIAKYVKILQVGLLLLQISKKLIVVSNRIMTLNTLVVWPSR